MIKSLLIKFILILILITLLKYPNNVIIITSNTLNIWYKSLIPSLFPIFIITDLLIETNFFNCLLNLIKPIENKISNYKYQSLIVFIISLLAGFPSNAKISKKLLEKNILTEKEVEKIITFTHFPNPLFILGTISISFLENKKIGYLIMISTYIPNILIKIFTSYKANKKQIIKNKIEKEKRKFSTLIHNSILNSINTLFLILGTITFFSLLSFSLTKILNLNPFISSIINGILELSGGIKSISMFNLSLQIKTTIIVAFISFGSLSIHMQVFSILEKYKINYLKYFKIRIIHMLISSSLFYFLYNLCY